MKIAVAVTPENPVPPPKYGGAEKRADIIVRKLMARGHTVHLYCGPNSTCPADDIFMTSSIRMSQQSSYITEVLKRRRKGFEYDVMLDMTAHHVFGWPKAREHQIKSLSLMAGDPHKKYPHDELSNRVYVSKEFAAFNDCPDHPVLHNIIHENPESIPYEYPTPDNPYALYVGAIRPEKGVHIAARACQKIGMTLKVAGPIRNEEYWSGIKPLKHVEYLGIIDNNSDEKWKLFGQASVFLFPVLWCDAGPLVVMESLLAGTPVVGFANGGICSDVINKWDTGNGRLIYNEPHTATELCIAMCYTLSSSWTPKQIHDSILPKIDPNKYITKLIRLLKRTTAGEEW